MRLLFEPSVERGIGILQISQDFEVTSRNLAYVYLIDVHDAKKLLHRLWHGASAFIATTATLRDSDAAPELLLIES